MATSHRGPQCCQGHLSHMPSRALWPKGPPAPSKAPSPSLAATWLVLTQHCEVEGCSEPSSQRAVAEQGGSLSDLP